MCELRGRVAPVLYAYRHALPRMPRQLLRTVYQLVRQPLVSQPCPSKLGPRPGFAFRALARVQLSGRKRVMKFAARRSTTCQP